MFRKDCLNLNTLKALNEVFKRLNCLRRWTSFIKDDTYNEHAKQGFNCIATYLLASYAEEKGKIIHWENFPKIVLYRAFKKVYVSFDTPEHINKQVCEIGNIEKEAFDEKTKQYITELTNEDFCNFICEGLNTYEMKIYKAATKLTSKVELSAIGKRSTLEYFEKKFEIQKSIKNFYYIPGVKVFNKFYRTYFRRFKKISKLRNQNRWSVYPYLLNCSVLGHLLDTAIFSYLIGLQNFDERVAAMMFFMGIFHDLGEVWTTDYPSPIKYGIPGLKKAVDIFEEIMLNKHFFSKISSYIAENIRNLLKEKESTFHKWIKPADMLAADSECWRQCRAGTRDPYFKEAIEKFDKQLSDNVYQLPPLFQELHDYYLRYAKFAIKDID